MRFPREVLSETVKGHRRKPWGSQMLKIEKKDLGKELQKHVSPFITFITLVMTGFMSIFLAIL